MTSRHSSKAEKNDLQDHDVIGIILAAETLDGQESMKSTGEAIEKIELVECFKKKKSTHSVHRVDIQTANDLIQSISENWVLRLGHIGITAVSAYLEKNKFVKFLCH